MEHLEQSADAFFKDFVALLPNLIGVAVVLLGAWILCRLIKRPVESIVKRRGLDSVAEKYIKRMMSFLIWFLAAVISMDQVGIPVGSVLTLFAAVGAAVALAVRDSLANFVSGLMLLFVKPFSAGDYIEVEDKSGVITDIRLVHTYINTPENILVAVPNTKMMTATICNYTINGTIRRDIKIPVSYGTDIGRAREVILSAAAADPRLLSEPEAPQIILMSYGDSALELVLRFWCNEADRAAVMFELNERVLDALNSSGIEIPFNQLDVNLKNKSGSVKLK